MFFLENNFVLMALIAGIFTWSITALGSAIVFLFRKINKNVMDAMLALSAGVMVAASFWSLLAPSIEMAEDLNMIPWLVVSIGFLAGGILLILGNKIFDAHDKKKKVERSDRTKRSIMLVCSITLHNIPEGLAIGVAFGSLFYGGTAATLASAIALAVGIGIQNFPEGSAVSLPLRREGMSRGKAFFWGQMSAIVEPISALLGALLVTKVQYLLPPLLAFAAGAMIFVTAKELIPESQTNPKKDLMAIFMLFGFAIMMILDVALG